MVNSSLAPVDYVPTCRDRLADMPFLGVGLGYRAEFRQDLLANQARVDFLELMLEHFIDMPPERKQEAKTLSESFGIVVHGLELSLGTVRLRFSAPPLLTRQ